MPCVRVSGGGQRADLVKKIFEIFPQTPSSKTGISIEIC